MRGTTIKRSETTAAYLCGLGLAAALALQTARSALAAGATGVVGPPTVTTGPVTRPAVRATYGGPTAADVPKLVDDLLGNDAAARSLASAKLKNLPYDGLDAIRTALKDPNLSPEAELALKQAERFAAPRAREHAKDEAFSDWSRRTGREAYDRVGSKDPKWDAAVREGLDQLFSLPPGHDAAALLKKARDAGCDDPFVTFAYARALAQDPATHDEVKKLLREAAGGMAASRYPPGLKLAAMLRCYEVTTDKSATPADECLKLFTEAVGEKDLPIRAGEEWIKLLRPLLIEEYGKEEGRKKLIETYVAARPGEAESFRLKGDYYYNSAWRARGTGFVNTVTPEGWRLFEERLAVSKEALEAAWQADPSDARIASQMISVRLGLAGAGRDEMGKWFGRAVSLDPTLYEAYDRKFFWLLPQWYGSDEELLRYGHECLALDEWGDPGVSFILILSHEQVRADKERGQEYWLDPVVWADVQAVYERDLSIFPGNQYARARYASYAYQSHHWDVAVAQFDALGDHPSDAAVKVFGETRKLYQYFREYATATKEGRPPPPDPGK